MSTSVDPVYAVLALSAYREGRDVQNRVTNLPDGVTPVTNGDLAYFHDAASGFEASTFFYDGKVVISFAGTLFTDDLMNPDLRPDLVTNGALGLGFPSKQLELAAEFYQRVKQAYGDNVVFTGFVREGQPVHLKLTAFPFQKYGMLEGVVKTVSADSSAGDARNTMSRE